MNPLTRLRNDRSAAKNQNDANADICFMSLSLEGQPSVRTLVTRGIEPEGITLFINKTSAKWTTILSNALTELLFWYPSLQKQFRVTGHVVELDRSHVENNWPNKPNGSKFLDYAYSSLAPQGTPVDSRAILMKEIERLKGQNRQQELTTPDTATAVLVQPTKVEILELNNHDNIHDRRSYRFEDSNWVEQILIP